MAGARPTTLALAAGARALDAEAAQWGLDALALVEAAGRACADALALELDSRGIPVRDARFVALVGGGNNAADALVMLRALVLCHGARAGRCRAYLVGDRGAGKGEASPLSQAALALRRLGARVDAWDVLSAREELLGGAAPVEGPTVVADGIAGTGLEGALCGEALEMALAAREARDSGALVVSIDAPSGARDGWNAGEPTVAADVTLAIEPRKLCLYAPALRPSAGKIAGVGGLFPPELIERHGDAELLTWESASARVPKVPPATHKYGRGVVEIRAGSHGAAGAAVLAALGAQAAGAGIVRLAVDDALYPVAACAVACASPGVMVTTEGALIEAESEGRFVPDAALLGPGWGRGADRALELERYLAREGLPLVLDADALALAKGATFGGRAILTPHVGEFAALSGVPAQEILADPARHAREFARRVNAVLLLKSHVTFVASPDGRLAVIDGMNPALAAGGTGDALAGLCAGIAARMARSAAFDPYDCACAAAALLAEAAESAAGRFAGPEEIARAAAVLTGAAWLGGAP